MAWTACTERVDRSMRGKEGMLPFDFGIYYSYPASFTKEVTPFYVIHNIAVMSKTVIQKIVPHFWFDNNAEEAAKFYTSIFKNSKIVDIVHYGKVGAEVSGRALGRVMTVTFELEGQRFTAAQFSSSLQLYRFLCTAKHRRK